MDEGRKVPHNLDAEKTLIACILIDNQVFSRVSETLVPDHFYSKAHNCIYEAMTELDGQGKPITTLTIIDMLKKKGTLEQAGGAAYLAEILDFATTTVNLDYFIEQVKEKYMLRELLHESEKIIEECYSPESDVKDIIDRAEKHIFSIGQSSVDSRFTPFKDLVRNSLESVENLYKNKVGVTGLSTGFRDFDKQTSGLQASDLIILAARPSMGKTSFGLNIIEHVALEEKKGVAFFSLEMSSQQVVLRMLSTYARIGLQNVRTGFISEMEFPRLAQAAATLSTAPVYIDDTPGISAMELRSKARRLKAQYDIQLIVIDYLQLMQGSPSKRSESRQQDISDISRSLKGIARELDVPVIALSQLNRSVEQRPDHRPMLSDLRESGSIEQDADVVIMLLRKDYYDDTAERGVTDVILAKQRNGPVGTVEMVFLSEITRFQDKVRDDVAEREENQYA